MAIADMIPTMADAELASLKLNATRLQATGSGAQQGAAAALLPLIEAEMAERLSRNPPAKPARGRKAKAADDTVKAPAKKASKASAKAAALATDEEPA